MTGKISRVPSPVNNILLGVGSFTSYSFWEIAKNNKNKKINYEQYLTFSESIRKYFGKYSGYAQQYLFYYMRQSAGKKW